MLAIILSLPARVHAGARSARGPRIRETGDPGRRANAIALSSGLRVDFRVAEPGIVLGGIRDNGGPKQLSADARADPIGDRIDFPSLRATCNARRG